jgi:hypothetical protein
MRALSIFVLAFAPAVAAAQALSSPAQGKVIPPYEWHGQLPNFTARAEPLVAKLDAATEPTIVIVPRGARLATPNNSCLTMRVYQYSAANPRKLTGYTECSKVNVGAVRNVEAVPVR